MPGPPSMGGPMIPDPVTMGVRPQFLGKRDREPKSLGKGARLGGV